MGNGHPENSMSRGFADALGVGGDGVAVREEVAGPDDLSGHQAWPARVARQSGVAVVEQHGTGAGAAESAPDVVHAAQGTAVALTRREDPDRGERPAWG